MDNKRPPFMNPTLAAKKTQNQAASSQPQADTNKKSRVREASANFFKEALQEDSDITCDAQKLAEEIEEEIFNLYKTDSSKQYRDKINSVKMKLKGARNSGVRQSLVSGQLSTRDLCSDGPVASLAGGNKEPAQPQGVPQRNPLPNPMMKNTAALPFRPVGLPFRPSPNPVPQTNKEENQVQSFPEEETQKSRQQEFRGSLVDDIISFENDNIKADETDNNIQETPTLTDIPPQKSFNQPNQIPQQPAVNLVPKAIQPIPVSQEGHDVPNQSKNPGFPVPQETNLGSAHMPISQNIPKENIDMNQGSKQEFSMTVVEENFQNSGQENQEEVISPTYGGGENKQALVLTTNQEEEEEEKEEEKYEQGKNDIFIQENVQMPGNHMEFDNPIEELNKIHADFQKLVDYQNNQPTIEVNYEEENAFNSGSKRDEYEEEAEEEVEAANRSDDYAIINDDKNYKREFVEQNQFFLQEKRQVNERASSENENSSLNQMGENILIYHDQINRNEEMNEAQLYVEETQMNERGEEEEFNNGNQEDQNQQFENLNREQADFEGYEQPMHERMDYEDHKQIDFQVPDQQQEGEEKLEEENDQKESSYERIDNHQRESSVEVQERIQPLAEEQYHAHHQNQNISNPVIQENKPSSIIHPIINQGNNSGPIFQENNSRPSFQENKPKHFIPEIKSKPVTPGLNQENNRDSVNEIFMNPDGDISKELLKVKVLQLLKDIELERQRTSLARKQMEQVKGERDHLKEQLERALLSINNLKRNQLSVQTSREKELWEETQTLNVRISAAEEEISQLQAANYSLSQENERVQLENSKLRVYQQEELFYARLGEMKNAEQLQNKIHALEENNRILHQRFNETSERLEIASKSLSARDDEIQKLTQAHYDQESFFSNLLSEIKEIKTNSNILSEEQVPILRNPDRTNPDRANQQHPDFHREIHEQTDQAIIKAPLKKQVLNNPPPVTIRPVQHSTHEEAATQKKVNQPEIPKHFNNALDHGDKKFSGEKNVPATQKISQNMQSEASNEHKALPSEQKTQIPSSNSESQRVHQQGFSSSNIKETQPLSSINEHKSEGKHIEKEIVEEIPQTEKVIQPPPRKAVIPQNKPENIKNEPTAQNKGPQANQAVIKKENRVQKNPFTSSGEAENDGTDFFHNVSKEQKETINKQTERQSMNLPLQMSNNPKPAVKSEAKMVASVQNETKAKHHINPFAEGGENTKEHGDSSFFDHLSESGSNKKIESMESKVTANDESSRQNQNKSSVGSNKFISTPQRFDSGENAGSEFFDSLSNSQNITKSAPKPFTIEKKGPEINSSLNLGNNNAGVKTNQANKNPLSGSTSKGVTHQNLIGGNILNQTQAIKSVDISKPKGVNPFSRGGNISSGGLFKDNDIMDDFFSSTNDPFSNNAIKNPILVKGGANQDSSTSLHSVKSAFTEGDTSRVKKTERKGVIPGKMFD